MDDITTSEGLGEGSEAHSPFLERFARNLALTVEKGESGEVEMDCVEEGSEVGKDGDEGGELPEHLVDSILAKLPVFTFLRLRSVCKRWNNLISNPLFLENCSAGTEAAPLFLLYPDRARQSYPTYDPSWNKWYHVPQTVSVSPSPGNSSRPLFIKAAAGGLLCLTDGHFSSEEGIDLYVSNPITRAWRRLPPMIRMSKSFVVRMVVNSVQNTYKVVVVISKENLQVYDSVSNSWQMIGGVLNRHRQAMMRGNTSCEGILYGLTGGTDTTVSAYHVDGGVWEDLRAPMPAYLTCAQLFVSRGQLMLIGAIPINGVIQAVCVWQLDSQRTEWVELLRVPDSLLSGLPKGGRLGFYDFFVPGGEFVCFAHFRVNQLLMCNVFKNTWWWLPTCPVDPSTDAANSSRFPRNLSGFPLQPSLVVSV